MTQGCLHQRFSPAFGYRVLVLPTEDGADSKRDRRGRINNDIMAGHPGIDLPWLIIVANKVTDGKTGQISYPSWPAADSADLISTVEQFSHNRVADMSGCT
jgi:hypothetical protein